MPQVLTVDDGAGADAFVYGANRIGIDRAEGSNGVFSYDPFGSALRNPDTAEVVRADAYSPYGQQANPAFNDPLAHTPAFGYRGELMLDNTIHLRARTYVPAEGVFTTRDPLDGAAGTPTVTSPYHYTANDPINKVDPLGLRPGDCSFEFNGDTRPCEDAAEIYIDAIAADYFFDEIIFPIVDRLVGLQTGVTCNINSDVQLCRFVISQSETTVLDNGLKSSVGRPVPDWLLFEAACREVDVLRASIGQIGRFQGPGAPILVLGISSDCPTFLNQTRGSLRTSTSAAANSGGCLTLGIRVNRDPDPIEAFIGANSPTLHLSSEWGDTRNRHCRPGPPIRVVVDGVLAYFPAVMQEGLREELLHGN
ncbi:MAG: hypothetical protein DCC48_18480 [Acidobacteria bacterium]|nr:MAG: hypothetical protein DCC48_18480 [Acidobacteriota bacterium]